MPFFTWSDRVASRPTFGACTLSIGRIRLIDYPQVLIKHRAPDSALQLVESILRPFGSRYVHLSYEDHDLVTANTQAVTHAAFLRYDPVHNIRSSMVIPTHPAWELHGPGR